MRDVSHASRTAQGVAAVRAAEMVLTPDGRRVFEDRDAHRLLSGYRRHALRQRCLLRCLVALDEAIYPGMSASILVRAAYARRRLEVMIGAGVRQVVIVGAGFDTTAWTPGLPSDLLVFEVDHPATQTLKRRRLAAAGMPIPPLLRFVGLEIESGGLRAALSQAGHRSTEPTFVTMLGLLPYLTPAAVSTLLGEVSGLIRTGGETVYTYLSAAALDPSAAPDGARRLARRLARLGEPFRFAADPGTMREIATAAALDQVESLDGRAMTAMLPAGDGRVVSPVVNLARAVAISLRSPS